MSLDSKKFHKEKVRVIVAGLVKTGKSTVVQVIQEALEKAGIACVARVEMHTLISKADSPATRENQRRRIKNVSANSYVEIEERNMYHSIVPGEVRIQGLSESMFSLIEKYKRKKRVQPRRKK